MQLSAFCRSLRLFACAAGYVLSEALAAEAAGLPTFQAQTGYDPVISAAKPGTTFWPNTYVSCNGQTSAVLHNPAV